MNFISGIFFLVLMAAAGSLQAQHTSIQLKNLLSVERKDELIELDRVFVEKKMGRKVDAGGIELDGVKGQFVTLQFDDLDQDGQWDKMVFLLSFLPKEIITVKLLATAPAADVIEVVRAHVRQQRKREDNSFGPSLARDSVAAGQPSTDFNKSALPPFLTEGPAWENDKVGFRIYMDIRNTKDIWGKTTAAMMMDKVGVDPKVIYHHLAPWGMDILAVGKSLGAGSLALSVPRAGKADTLVRLGGLNMGPIQYRKIADGPVRAIFRMEYPAWNVLGDGTFTRLSEQISIWGGQYFYESKVFVEDAPAGAKLVTGIVNLKSNKPLTVKEDKSVTLYTFAKQSENGDNLGLAVSVHQSDLVSLGKTPDKGTEVLNTYTTLMKIPLAGKSTGFRFYAGWEHTDPAFATEAGFRDFLVMQLKTAGSPVSIR